MNPCCRKDGLRGYFQGFIMGVLVCVLVAVVVFGTGCRSTGYNPPPDCAGCVLRCPPGKVEVYDAQKDTIFCGSRSELDRMMRAYPQ